VGGAELGKQDGLQGGGRSGGLGCLRKDEGGKKEGEEDWFDRHGLIALLGKAVVAQLVYRATKDTD